MNWIKNIFFFQKVDKVKCSQCGRKVPTRDNKLVRHFRSEGIPDDYNHYCFQSGYPVEANARNLKIQKDTY